MFSLEINKFKLLSFGAGCFHKLISKGNANTIITKITVPAQFQRIQDFVVLKLKFVK